MMKISIFRMSTLFIFTLLRVSQVKGSSIVEWPWQNQRPLDVDLKDIPEFRGKIQPDEFIDWLNTVERVFYLKEVSVKRKVKVVVTRLLFWREWFSFIWHGLKGSNLWCVIELSQFNLFLPKVVRSLPIIEFYLRSDWSLDFIWFIDRKSVV